MRGLLIGTVVVMATLWGMARWLQPRMAFFPTRGVQTTPAAFGLAFSDLKITTSDGEKLHGWWIEHPAPRAQVIYWHGNGGNLSLWLPVLADLRNRGFSVMAVDYRGYGGSSGSPSERGLYRDAEAATGYFNQHLRRPGAPTVYWGRSLGCAVASYAARQVPPEGLILESPFPDVRSLFSGNPIMLGLSFFSSYTFSTSAHLEAYRSPLLVIHGDADSIIPFRAGQQVFGRARTATKSFAVLKGANHNDVHTGHPAYWPSIDPFISGLAAR
ncbi:MAG: alpha/beta hydrolase [Acidobacteria bacterium]|nr:alpha/beta hydrolase [Acidobacteriota bacterium]